MNEGCALCRGVLLPFFSTSFLTVMSHLPLSPRPMDPGDMLSPNSCSCGWHSSPRPSQPAFQLLFALVLLSNTPLAPREPPGSSGASTRMLVATLCRSDAACLESGHNPDIRLSTCRIYCLAFHPCQSCQYLRLCGRLQNANPSRLKQPCHRATPLNHLRRRLLASRRARFFVA